METKAKTFDAVAESRKWREVSSRKLNAMNRDERLIYPNIFDFSRQISRHGRIARQLRFEFPGAVDRHGPWRLSQGHFCPATIKITP